MLISQITYLFYYLPILAHHFNSYTRDANLQKLRMQYAEI
jgi:hypothetical protein